MTVKKILEQLQFILREFDPHDYKPGEAMRKPPHKLVAELVYDILSSQAGEPGEPEPLRLIAFLVHVRLSLRYECRRLEHGDVDTARVSNLLHDLVKEIDANIPAFGEGLGSVPADSPVGPLFAALSAEHRATIGDLFAAMPAGFVLTVTAPGPFEDG